MEEKESLPVKRKRSSGGHSKPVHCLKCNVLTQLNAYELCNSCRERKCKKCGDIYKLNRSHSDHCSPCRREILKRSRRLGDS